VTGNRNRAWENKVEFAHEVCKRTGLAEFRNNEDWSKQMEKIIAKITDWNVGE